MQVIDENGNLFGTVNVIDVLVVMVVLAVVVAGISVLSTSGSPGATPSPTPTGTPTPTPTATPTPSENASRYVTVELGTLPTYVATAVSSGDVVRKSGGRTMRITDVHTVPAANEQTWTTVRLAVDGRMVGLDHNRTFQFGGTTLRRGATVGLVTADYRVDGRVTAVDRSGERIDTATRTIEVTLSGLPPTTANALETGLVGRSTGSTYAEITSVTVEPSTMVVTDADGTVHVVDHPTRKRVTLSVELTVRASPGGDTFQGRRLYVGGPIHLDFGSVVVDGRVTGLAGS